MNLPKRSEFKQINTIELLMLRNRNLLFHGYLHNGESFNEEITLMKRLIKKGYVISFVITYENETFYTVHRD